MERISKSFDKTEEFNKYLRRPDIDQTLRNIMLGVMDKNWANHIVDMEEMKKFIGFESQPVYAYNQRGREMFDAMMEGDRLESIQEIITSCRNFARTYDNVYGGPRREPKSLFVPTRA